MAIPPRSAAVQIINPAHVAPKTPVKDVSTTDGDKGQSDRGQKICRNVMIYGACKYENTGCPYYHPPVNAAETPDSKGSDTTRSSIPSFTPSSKPSSSSSKPSTTGRSGFGAEHLSAPVFVPKTPIPEGSPRSESPAIGPAPTQTWPVIANAGGLVPQLSESSTASHSHDVYDTSMYDHQAPGMDSNMYMSTATRTIPLDQNLYVSPLPHVANPPMSHNLLHSFFIPDDLRRMVQARQHATYAKPQIPNLNLPQELGTYHSLVPLGAPLPPPSRVYGHPSPVYKAVSSVDGNVYVLRRVEGYRVSSEVAFANVDTWRRMRHPNIVGLREAFTTKAFEDDSLIMVYDYFPESTTVFDEHLADPRSIGPMARRRTGMPVQERLLWSYVTQISNALKAIHSSGLAARNLDPTKLLITGKNRIRLNGCGVLDVMTHDQPANLVQQQQEDLANLGRLIMSLGCEFYHPGQTAQAAQAALEHIGRQYSPDVRSLVQYLLAPRGIKNIDEVIRAIGPRILNEIDASMNYVDVLESELGAEVENGRLVRLMAKLAFVNERKEFERDSRWSETGDRYILKLFRDYVFHSTGADGSPVLDLSHVLTCLNKLDAGVDERVMLVSRDEQSCLVVSYRDLKACVEGTYNELKTASVAGAGGRTW